MGVRWVRPKEGGFIQLVALWPGMAAPVMFLVNEYRTDASGLLEVRSGDGCPFVAVLPNTPAIFLTEEKIDP